MLTQQPALVGDINQATQGSDPRLFVSFAGCLYFVNEGPGRPPQLWRADPATGEVALVDSTAGADYQVQELKVAGNRLYARGYDPSAGWSLFQVDAAAGSLLTRVEGTAGADPQGLSTISGKLYYSAYAYGSSGQWLGRELVRLDPQTGQIQIFDLHPDGGWSNPRLLTELNGRLFFLANGAGTGEELWGFNPATEAGPQLLRDIWPGGNSASIDNLTASGGKLYFTASDGSTDEELWVSDGTAAGTIRVADINQNTYGSDPQPVVSSGGKFFFTAFNDASGWELHSLDPTSGALRKLEIRPGGAGSEPGGNGGGFADLNGSLYFSAYDDSNSWQLWRLQPDGSLQILPLGLGASTPQGLTVVGGTLYFAATGYSNSGISLSRSFSLNGEAVTLSFDFLRLDSWDGEPLYLYIDNQLIFVQPFVWTGNDGTRTGSSGDFSWSITATSPTQEMGGLAYWPDQIFRISVSIPAGRTNIRLGLVSGLDQSVEDESYGIRNLEIRPTANPSQVLLSDPGTDPSLWTGGISSSLPDLGTFIGRYGGASSLYLGRELWRIDNATGDPVPMDINPGSASSDPWWLFNVGGKLYFTAYTPGVGHELWTVDPADNVPHLVADVNPGEAHSRISWWYNSASNSVVTAGGRLYYAADGPQGRELYMVAPGIAGAQLLDLNLGAGGSDPQNFIVVGERLFFRAYDGSSWGVYTTGVETGVPTRLSIPGLTTYSYYTDSFIGVGNRLYFRGTYYNDNFSTYRPLFTVDVSTGVASAVEGISFVEWLTSINGQLFFRGVSSTHNTGHEIYSLAADDPAQAPKPLDLLPGPNGSSSGLLTAGPDALYAVAYGRPLEDLSRVFNLNGEAATLAFDLIRLDTWDGENLRLDLNGQEVFSQTFSWGGNAETRTGSSNGYNWSIAPISPVDYFGGNPNYQDQIFRISVSIPSGNNSIRLSLGSHLDEAQDNESYGIRNLEIRTAADPSQLLHTDPGDDPNLWQGGRLASSTALGSFLAVEGGTNDWNIWRLDPVELNRTMRPLLPASMPNKSSINNLFSTGGLLYFSYDDGVNGRELWQSDGTAAGTRLAANINGRTLPSNPRLLTDVNGKLYFTADDGIRGRSLYGLDPATGVVQRLEVPGLTQGNANSIDKLVNANGRLYFRSNGYHSDGTYLSLFTIDPSTGTISRVAGHQYVDGLKYLNGQLFFTAYTTSTQEGYELFRIADGSTQPQLIDVNPNGSSSVQELIQAGSVIYFTAEREGLGRELFRLDASFAATPVRDIRPGTSGSNPRSLFAVGSSLYFVANDGFHDVELWQTDGTEAGTRLARDINNLTLDSNPGNLLDVNGILYFTATDGTLGRGLYRIDPGTGTPRRLTIPGLTGGNEASIDSLINANGRLYFRANSYNDASTYRPLYTLDPETNSISQVNNLSYVDGLQHLNGQLLFAAYSATYQEGHELYRIADGSTQPQLIDINPVGSSSPDQLTLNNGTVYFAAYGEGIGREMYRLNAAFEPIPLANLSRYDTNPRQISSLTDAVYFVGYGAAVGLAGPGQDASRSFNLDGSATSISFDLLRLDSWDGESFTVYLDDQPLFSKRFFWYQATAPSAAGTVNGVSWSLTATSDPSDLYGYNTGYSISYDQTFRVTLDLPAGYSTVKLGFGSGLDEAASNESYAIDNLEIRGGNNAVIASDSFATAGSWQGGVVTDLAGAGSVLGLYGSNFAPENWRLWKINTTSDRVEEVSIPSLGLGMTTSIDSFLAVGNRVFFRYPGWDGSTYYPLYSIDPATSIASRVEGLQDVYSLWKVNGSLYVSGTYASQGGRLLKLDANANVTPIDLQGSTSPAWLTPVGNTLYFTANSYATSGEWLGNELWKIDSASGQARVIDVRPGPSGSNPRELVNVDGTLYFIASREESGTWIGDELYRIDPITDQAELLGDIYSGSGSSNPTGLTLSNGKLYFTATDILHGRELWRVQVSGDSSGIEVSRSLAEDSSLLFSADDFATPYAAAGGGTLQAIRILSLPVNGQLRLNGEACTVNQTIAAAAIGQLSFVPNADYNGTAGFTWSGSNGGSFDGQPSLVNLTVTPLSDAPRLQQPLVNRTIFSNRNDSYTFDLNTFRDPDPGQTLSYSATLADGSPLPAWISLNGRSFSFNPPPSAAGDLNLRVIATDPDGLSSLAAADPGSLFNLQVINAAPQDLGLSNYRISENSANGTVVGTFFVSDPNSRDLQTLTLLDSADGRFALAGSAANGYSLVVADGSRLDYETATSHLVMVRATDETGQSLDKYLSIQLDNLADSAAGNLTFSAANFSIREDGVPLVAVTVNRVGGVEGSVSATVQLTPGSATYPADYSLELLTVVFANGETSRTIAIPIANDALIEGDQTLTLTLTNPTGGAFLTGQVSATLTIVDNDFPTIPSPTVTAQITNDSTPLISGTADVAISNQFRVSLNGRTYSLGSSPELVLTGTSWSLAIPAAHALGDGLYNVVATVQDPNGSSVSDASNGELRIDTVAPLTTLTSAASPLYFPLLQGRSEPGAVLQVSCGGASWSLSVPVDGNWQLDTATTPLSGSFAPNRDGANPLTISATDGAGNSSLFSGQLTILYPYPDLRISAASLNSGASLDTVVLDYTVVNNTPSGPLLPGHIASGSWIDRFYLSPDAVYGNGNDLAIGPLLAPSLGRGQAVNGPLASGASTTSSLNVQLPEYPGSYYLIAVTDADRSLAEGVGEANNVFISAAPITVAPIYTASVSTAVTNLNAGQSISLSGQLVHTTSSIGVAGKSVTVVFFNDTTGQRFERQLTSGADGGFSFSFTPSVEQAGAYRVAARYSQNPAEDLADGGSLNAEDSFRVQGLAVSPGNPIVAAIAEGATYSGNLQLRNSGADTLSLSDLSVSGAPSGWNITLGTLPASLAAGASTTVSYQVSAPNASVLFDDFELIATAAASGLEPLSARQPLAITILPNRPVLGVAAAQRSAAMLLGQRTLHEVTISNSGNASTGALNVVLPGGAPWLSLYGSPTLAPLAPGASTSILLALDPPADLALATYQASIGFLDEVHPADSLVVPFSFRATSSQSGSVSVAIYDEFSSAPSYPTVSNVSVWLYDRIGDSLLQTINDADGRFSFNDLPVGEYAIEVRADRHASSWKTFRIDPGDAEQLDVFLPSEFVRYSWVVVPTTVQDRYLITLEATFETEVPVPVVTITPTPVDLRSLDLLNQSVVIPLTITNHGLVAARDLYFQAPTDPNFSFTILGPLTGEVIAAESSLLVDLRIERIAELPNTCTNVELGTLYWDYGTFLPTQVAPITIEKSTPLPFLIDSDCPSPLPPGAPEGGFGGGGGGFPSIPDLITVAPSPVPLPYVTARVKIRIEQEAVLARDGFEGTFILENLDPSIDITNIDIDLEILDEDGNLVNDRFVISSPALLGFSGDLNGGGSVAANSSGTAVYTILAKNTAAPIAATQYSIGGRVSYSRADGSVNFNLAPAAITVLPQPVLAFDYFLQRDVFSDDPFTTSLKEASQPFVLGLLAHNRGYGIANDLVITSADPEIIENELGLKIGFDLIGAAVNGSSVAPSLSIDLGDLASQSTSEAYWLMTSTLQGRFIDYKASFEYINPLGIKDVPGLSQLTEVNLHELTHRVRDHRPGADLRFDYLVNSNPPVVGQDNTTKDLIPDILYLSNDSTEAVTALAPDHPSIALSAINDAGEASLSFAAASGWTYLRVLEPSLGNRPITAIRRADGSLISADNFWITDRTFPEHGRPTYESSLHILDYANEAGSTSYTLLFGPPITNAAPTLVVSLADQLAKETFPFFFIVPSSSFLDTDAGDSLSYTATLDSGDPLPAWLSFNPATRTFSGTPGPSDAGTLQLNVTATDRGGLAISDSFSLLVEPVNSVPVVSTPIPDQTINTGLPWLYTLPASTFSDPDPTDLLTYSASLADGSPLPAWLSFDPDSRSFSGTPVDADATNLSIKVVATDPAGASTSDSFALTVLDATPPVITSITVVGTQLQLQFSEAIVTTGLSSSRFTASVAGANRTITSLAAVAGAPNRLNLTLSGSAPTSSQTLSLRYTDLSTANDASGVVQDGSGNDMQSIAAPGRNVETFSSATSVTSLAASYTNLLLTGTASGAVANSLNNSIRVNQTSSVNNVFTGAGGIDSMDAGNGSDLYLIANSNEHTAAEISDSGTGATDTDEIRFASTTAGQTLTVFAGDTGLERITIGTGVAAAAVTTATTALHINAAAAPNALTITGNAGNNTLTGSAYNDLLDGAAGLDAMDGTGGSDLYLINSSLHHSAAEISDSGAGDGEIDELRFTSTTANQILSIFAGDTGLERITIGTGTAANAVTTAATALSINASSAPNALTITGNNGINTLTGSAYNDTLTGNNGNDILNGGAGNDSLSGGAGADIFRFDSSLNGLSNVDHITDFKSTETDRIQLENSIFSGLPTTGTLAATAFLVGSAALTSAHRILFNTTTNTLLYDPDGSNPLAATAFATLTPGLTLSNSQFTIT